MNAIFYLLACVLLILGLKQMSSPTSAWKGFILASVGVLVASLLTLLPCLLHPNLNTLLLLISIASATMIAAISGVRVKMIQMPQMIAIYNAMGGLAAALIGVSEFLYHSQFLLTERLLSLLAILIGSLAFSGSILAFAKLQDWLLIIQFRFQKTIIFLFIGSIIFLFPILLFLTNASLLATWGCILLICGALITLPIGGANMPILISLYNAMTGLSVALSGFTLSNPLLVVAGLIVGASGLLLTRLMAKAMNQSVLQVLWPHTQELNTTPNSQTQVTLKAMQAHDVAASLVYANSVIIVPGYGMAVAQAQHPIAELCKSLSSRNIQVKFAIHPVAGRMPGHMNVLLAEAGIPYEMIYDMDVINPDFAQTDIVIVMGANDVVNPAARHQQSSPIYGMPILNVDQARQVIVIKRGQGKGFSGIENELFGLEHVWMLYGDGAEVARKLVEEVKAL